MDGELRHPKVCEKVEALSLCWSLSSSVRLHIPVYMYSRPELIESTSHEQPHLWLPWLRDVRGRNENFKLDLLEDFKNVIKLILGLGRTLQVSGNTNLHRCLWTRRNVCDKFLVICRNPDWMFLSRLDRRLHQMCSRHSRDFIILRVYTPEWQTLRKTLVLYVALHFEYVLERKVQRTTGSHCFPCTDELYSMHKSSSSELWLKNRRETVCWTAIPLKRPWIDSSLICIVSTGLMRDKPLFFQCPFFFSSFGHKRGSNTRHKNGVLSKFYVVVENKSLTFICSSIIFIFFFTYFLY